MWTGHGPLWRPEGRTLPACHSPWQLRTLLGWWPRRSRLCLRVTWLLCVPLCVSSSYEDTVIGFEAHPNPA